MIRSRLRMTPDVDRLTVPAPRKPRMSKCTICREPFIKRSMTHKACKPECAAIVAQRKREKEQRKAAAMDRAETRRRKEALKTHSEHMNDLQKLVNEFCRLRDADESCISCGRHHKGQYHAGHYKSVGAHPELRFNEFNINKQCKPCNVDLSGNVLEYRKGLIAKHGIAKVEELEGPHPPLKMTVEECKREQVVYRLKIKQLKKGRAGVSGN